MAKESKSDLSRAFSEDGALKTHVGGQALLEGIMMRGKFNWAVAVREPEGTIYTEEHDLASGKDKNGWLYWPFVRGCRAFVESLALGYKALSIAAEHAFVEEDEDAGGAGAEAAGAGAGGASAEATAAGAGGPDAQPADNDAGVTGAQVAGGDTAGSAADHGVTATNGLIGETPRSVADGAAANNGSGSGISAKRTGNNPDFSWKRDFGNPDEMIDALGAQRTLEVVVEDGGVTHAFNAEHLVDDADSSQPFSDADSRQLAGAANSTQPAEIANTVQPVSTATSSQPIRTDQSSANTAERERPADIAISDQPAEAAPSTSDAADEDTGASAPAAKKPLLGDTEMLISMVLGLVLGVALFIVVPAFVTNLIVGEYDERTLLWNVVDGLLRIGIFIFYIWLIGRMSDIKRMFGYHGAEHKTIHCFEHGLPLTPENARSFPRLHVRCGTAFLIMVMIIAIFVYTITPIDALIAAWGVPDGAPKLALVIVVRILLMPVIAGVSYEITVKWAGSHPDNPLVKVILWPGMQMQYLTTREPDDGQIECAIQAMKLVLEREQREAAAASASSMEQRTCDDKQAA